MSASPTTAAKQLRAVLLRCGYVRPQSQTLYQELGHEVYKKGSEVRIMKILSLALRHPDLEQRH